MKDILAIALDVDGVLTDGGVWWGPDAQEWKRFSYSDIMGVSMGMKAGLVFALISGEDSPLVVRFAAKMGINWVSFEGRRMEYCPATPGEHYKLIVEATREKVRQNPEVRKVLLATGNLVLKPDHYQEPNAPAAWRYYEILSQIRNELQQHKP